MTEFEERVRKGRLALAASLLLGLGACDHDEVDGNSLDGLWWSQGYGLLLQIDGNDVKTIEQTPISCLMIRDGSLERLRSRFADEPDLDTGLLEVGSKATLSTIKFEVQDEDGLDRLCPNGMTDRVSDPELNFEVLWHTFNQHYAFFTERGVDWEAFYQRYRPTITKETSNAELARALGAMLNALKDAHVGFYVDGEDLVSVGTTVEASLAEACRREEGPDCDLDDFYDEIFDAFNDTLLTTYLDGDYETRLDGQAIWGRINDQTGYFRLDAMEGFGGGSTSSDLERIDNVLDDMLNDLGDLPTMIVDVRVNGGGHDTVSVAIANRFADQRRVFGTKQPFAGGDTTNMVITPRQNAERYDGEVVLLTSGETASAAEIFAMAMRALPNVTLIGTSTQGILSDEMYRTLPNGWSFSLSNEIYRAHDSKLFEGIGVPPDIEVPFLTPADLELDMDLTLDEALSELRDGADDGEKQPLIR